MSVVSVVRREILARQRAAEVSVAAAAGAAGLAVLIVGLANTLLVATVGARWLLTPTMFVVVAAVGGLVGWVAASRSVVSPPPVDREGAGTGTDGETRI